MVHEVKPTYKSYFILLEIHGLGVRIPNFLRDGVTALIAALKVWTSRKDEYVKYHKLQVPIEINAHKLIKSLEKELKHDMV